MDTTLEPQGTLRDILHIVFKHKVKICTLFFTVVLTVTAGSLLMSPTYEATSKILLKFGRENVYSPTTPAGGGTPIVMDTFREERLNSEVEMLTGRNLAEKVIRDIGLEALYPDLLEKPFFSFGASAKITPVDRALLVFEKKLTVEAVKKSNIIDIQFQHKDPAVAARVVNKLVAVFLEHHINVYRDSGEYGFFIEQVKLCEKKLKDAEEELKEFKSVNNITALQEQKSVLLKQIAEIETALAKTQGELGENAGRIRALKSHQSIGSEPGSMGQETDFNPYAISAIRNKLSELKLQEEKLLGSYNEQSIPVVKIRQEIERAKQLLEKEEKTYHAKAVSSINQNVSALKAKETSQQQHLTTYQAEINKISSAEMRLKELERQAKINEDNYQLYLKKLEETRISNAMDSQKLANISVVEPALPPIKPIKPKILLNIILSILLGVFASIGMAFSLEYFSHTFNKPEDVEQQVSLKVLAAIPSIKR
jgi:polysaccharide biosynthesis protein PslE